MPPERDQDRADRFVWGDEDIVIDEEGDGEGEGEDEDDGDESD